MKVKNINASSRKTDIQIKESFAELMKDKLELKNITVTELVSKAGITRSAFYTHYDSIYDLAQEIQDDTLDFLLEGTDDVKNLNDVFAYFDKVIIHLKENEVFYSMLLASNEPLLFTNKLVKIMKIKLKDFFNTTNNKKPDVAINFFSEGSVSLVVSHFKEKDSISLDEINSYMKVMFKKIFE